MHKVSLVIAVALVSAFALPRATRAEPRAGPDNVLQACGVLHQEDPAIPLAQCLGFLKASERPREAGWVPPFCRALGYYEPELFYSLYVSTADCVAHNEDG